MTILSEDDNLSIRIIVKLLFDSSLQLKYDGTRGINNLYVVPLCNLVCLRRLSMRTQQHFHIMKFP